MNKVVPALVSRVRTWLGCFPGIRPDLPKVVGQGMSPFLAMIQGIIAGFKRFRKGNG